jgi:hypothetical protein
MTRQRTGAAQRDVRRQRAEFEQLLVQAVEACTAIYDAKLAQIVEHFEQREQRQQEQLTGALEVVAQAVVEQRLGHTAGDVSSVRVGYGRRPLTSSQGQRLVCHRRRR